VLLIVIYQRLIFEQDEPFNFANMCQIANWLTAILRRSRQTADAKASPFNQSSMLCVVCHDP